MKLPIAGPAYESASQDINYQRCINWFPINSGPEGRGGIALLPTPGLKQIVSAAATGEVRAIIVFDDSIYAVVGATMYKVTFNEDAVTATVASQGTLSSDNGPVHWARNNTQIILVDGTVNGYIHTVSTDTFAEITDVDFIGGDDVVFMDSFFIVIQPNSAVLHSSKSSDGTLWDSIDVVTAEAAADNLVGLAVDKRELWAFGEQSVEVYFDAANATGFPFTRRDTALIDYGCASTDSIVNVDNALIFLDSRGFVVQAGVNSYQPDMISSEAISREIRSYSVTDDAKAYQYSDRGHLFYVLTFPTEKKTWVFDLSIRQWHERASFTQDDEFTRERINVHARFKSFDLVGDFENGNLYVMSDKYFDDDGDPIHRLRTTSFQQMEFNFVGVDSLEIHMESGKADQTGAGSDPQMMMRYSHDGGYTWSHQMARSIGKVGEYGKRIRWNRLGSGREWIFEFRITDDIAVALIDASVDPVGSVQA